LFQRGESRRVDGGAFGRKEERKVGLWRSLAFAGVAEHGQRGLLAAFLQQPQPGDFGLSRLRPQADKVQS